ncbi:hypothetical protein XF35_00140 [Streptomyces platensis subsp. clarensis]|nr:hypothetical protein [Streptomyces platensis subsp. clarensis]
MPLGLFWPGTGRRPGQSPAPDAPLTILPAGRPAPVVRRVYSSFFPVSVNQPFLVGLGSLLLRLRRLLIEAGLVIGVARLGGRGVGGG